jgi:FkbM family methyltransferase
MDSLIVCYKGTYWPKNDGSGITSDNASSDSSCFAILGELSDVPSLIAKYVPVKGVVLQAGGNCGIFPKKYAEMFQTVYTFEPDPVLFQCLTRNIDYPNVIKMQACLGNERKLVGTKNDVDPSCGATHIDERTGIIPTIFIDDLNLPRCDLIHLDIEGYEFNALRGGVKTIERCKPIIVLEYFARWLSRFGTNIEEIDSLLGSLGYSLVGEVKGDRVYRWSHS